MTSLVLSFRPLPYSVMQALEGLRSDVWQILGLLEESVIVISV